MEVKCPCKKCRALRIVKNRLFYLQQKPGVPIVTEKGKSYMTTEWIETDELNLGSVAHPNTNVIQFHFEPMIEEKEKKQIGQEDLFKKFFGG